jgi:hypothetical protein
LRVRRYLFHSIIYYLRQLNARLKESFRWYHLVGVRIVMPRNRSFWEAFPFKHIGIRVL